MTPLRGSFSGRFLNAFGSFLLSLGLFLHPAAGGDNLVPSGDFESQPDAQAWGADTVCRQNPEEAHSGDHSLRVLYKNWVLSPELIEIDPNGIYRLSSFFKTPAVSASGQEQEKVRYLLGFHMYDADGALIGGMSVLPVEGTERKLVAEASEGSSEIRMEGEPWERRMLDPNTPYDAIAFDVKSDYSDLPNSANYVIESITADRDATIVRLRKPLTQSYPTGTLVRQHAHVDYVHVAGEATPEWTESFIEVNGISEPGQVARDKFWPGTKKIQVGVIGGGGSTNETDFLIDDVSLIENK